MRHLLRTADLSVHDIEVILRRAEADREERGERDFPLRGRAVLCLFEHPTYRTGPVCESALARLGATPMPVAYDPATFGSVEDAAEVLALYATAVVAQIDDHAVLERFARAASVPVLNAGSAVHHPMQSLADLLTVRQHFGGLRGVRMALIGSASNATTSVLEAGALTGMEIVLCQPAEHGTGPAEIALAMQLAEGAGGSVSVVPGPEYAVAGAQVLYTVPWTRPARAATVRQYRVDEELVARAAHDAVVLHAAGRRVGDEVSAEVMGGPRSLVRRQAKNRLWVAQAALWAAIGGHLTGTPYHSGSSAAPASR